MHQDSPGWIFYSYVAFAISLAMMLIGIWGANIDMPTKGYFTMGIFFLTGSTFTLAKTLRDQHEAHKLMSKLEEAKAERLLKDYDNRQPA